MIWRKKPNITAVSFSQEYEKSIQTIQAAFFWLMLAIVRKAYMLDKTRQAARVS